MGTLSQRSFTGGELSPAVSARADLAKYQTGLSRLRNFFVMKHGGFSNRGGTEMGCEVSDSSRTIKHIPFVFSLEQSYVLEFGHLYMRVIKNNSPVSTVHATAVTGISVASQAVVTHTSHGYSTGDEVMFIGITGDMARMNRRIFTVESINANSYYIKIDGVRFDTGGLSAFGGTVTAYKIYKLTTPFVEDDLPTLHYIQSADVVTLTHPSYPIYALKRFSETSWTLEPESIRVSILGPASASVSAGAAGSEVCNYHVTAVDKDTFEESLPSVGVATGKTITRIRKSQEYNNDLWYPFVNRFYVAAHGYSKGDRVVISGITSDLSSYLNNQLCYINRVSTNYFECIFTKSNDRADVGVISDDTSPGAASVSTKVALTVTSATPTPSNPNVITWDEVEIAGSYNIYKAINGVYGFLGSAEAVDGNLTYNDIGLDPDISDSEPVDKNLFKNDGDYPSTATYFQQRKLYANSTNQPETVWGSKTGKFKNFTASNPLREDDSITFDLAGRRVNRIKHMLDLGRLVLLTEEGELMVGGDDSGILNPTQPVNIKQSSYNGCGDLPPILINSSAIYVQARGSIVRDLRFNIDINGFEGDDITIFSSHLFEGYEIVDWAYQKNPHSIVWAVRDDGVLLGLTYIKEQQLLAWHRHDLQGGLVENVSVIPEGANDSLYLTVKRTINGVTRRYFERMSVRNFSDITVDCKLLDSHLTYDGRNGQLPYAAESELILSGGTNWTVGETLDLSSSENLFNLSGSDIGNEFHLKLGGDIVRCEVMTYDTAKHVTVRPHKTVPVAFRGIAITDWARAVDRIEGLWHLEGEDVTIFGDGLVVANPNNRNYTVITVSGGAVDLPNCYGVAHVGLPITSDFETLDVEFVHYETMVGKKTNINKAHFKVLDSRGGLWVGNRKPTDAEELLVATFLNGLREEKIRQYEGYDDPIDLQTGEISVLIPGEWKSNGRIFGRVTDPVPCTILSVHPEGSVPIRGVA